MQHLLRIKPLVMCSCRFKSKVSDPTKVSQALKKYYRENKKQLGELLETANSKVKRTTKKKANEVSDEPDISSAVVPEEICSVTSHTSCSILKDPSSKKRKSKSKAHDLKSVENDATNCNKNALSDQGLEKNSYRSFSKDELITKKKEASQKAEILENDERENSQPGDENASKMNENVCFMENTSNDAEDEASYPSISNPYSSYTLLNELKKTYTPNSNYVVVNNVRPNHYPYPSVSHILSESVSSASEIHLKNWKENLISEMGNEEFQVYSKSLMHSAKSLRKLILLRLRGFPDHKIDVDSELLGCWESLKCVFPLFPKVKEIGKVAVHPELKYKGMVDSLIEFRNKLVIVSWKKANKYVPSLDKTYDLPIQCAAYMGAINFDSTFPFSVDEALLVMSYTNGMKADVFHLKTDQCQHYWKLWLERLNTYRMRTKKRDEDEVKNLNFGKLNIEEELAKLNESKVTSKIPEDSSPVFTVSNSNGVDNFSKSCSTFPLCNEEKSVYTSGQKFVLDNVNQTAFSLYPAVTTILGETKSASAKFLLERWKNNLIAELGVEGFETYHKKILETGISFHKLIQRYYEGVLDDIPTELMGCWDSLQNVFPLITEVKFTESKVVHEKLQYKGIVDCIAEFRDKLVVIDWKKSDKHKSTINMTYDAPLQIAAYVGAINFDSNYPFKIEEGLLIISYVDGSKADVYHLNVKNCEKYWEQWFQRLQKYQIQANSDCNKIRY